MIQNDLLIIYKELQVNLQGTSNQFIRNLKLIYKEPQINLQGTSNQFINFDKKVKQMIRRFQIHRLPFLLNKRYAISGSKIIRDDQQMSQDEIQSILGLEPMGKKQIYKQQNKQVQSVVRKQEEKEINKVRDLFYNLIPTKNQNFPICIDPEAITIQQTPTQNIFTALQLDKNCSYDQYSKALSNFWTQTDLYGDLSEKPQIKLQELQFKQLLTYDSPYIQKARQRFLVNISIPGSIQVEDPRNFMQLRPIQQFRHTPLVPISDGAMKKHQQMLEQYHRKQFIFQIKSQSILNFFLMSTALGVCGYLLYLILQKEEQRTVAYSRLKFKRVMGQHNQIKFKI